MGHPAPALKTASRWMQALAVGAVLVGGFLIYGGGDAARAGLLALIWCCLLFVLALVARRTSLRTAVRDNAPSIAAALCFLLWLAITALPLPQGLEGMAH